jgi:hypothetical protein
VERQAVFRSDSNRDRFVYGLAPKRAVAIAVSAADAKPAPDSVGAAPCRAHASAESGAASARTDPASPRTDAAPDAAAHTAASAASAPHAVALRERPTARQPPRVLNSRDDPRYDELQWLRLSR